MFAVQLVSVQCCFQNQQQQQQQQKSSSNNNDEKPSNLLRTHLEKSQSVKKSGGGVDVSSAHKVFDVIPNSGGRGGDSYEWNTLMRTHLLNGEHEKVMLIYRKMLLRGIIPDKHTFPPILNASRLLSGGGFFGYGKQIHGHALKLGFGSDPYVTTALMEMYGFYDGVKSARRLFDQSSKKNSVSWTLMSRLYIIENKLHSAIQLFYQMVKQLGVGEDLNSVALVTAIGACGRLKSLQEGRKIHEIAKKKKLEQQQQLESDVLVCNSLLKMYMDCGSMKDALLVFHRMSWKDIISWNSIMTGYVNNGEFNEALKLFRLMNLEGMKPDSFSCTSVLPACARISAGKLGKEIHGYTIRNWIDSNVQALQNALMDMYFKSGCTEYASRIFEQMKGKDNFLCCILIYGCILHGQGELGVELFHKMKNMGAPALNDHVYTAALSACNTARMVDEGMSCFKYIRAPQIEHYSLMVNLLARAGLFDEARSFIDEHQIEWHKEVQRALLAGCRIHRNTRLAKRVVERLIELEPLNAENYVLLSNLHAANLRWDLVKNLKEMIRDMGLKPKKGYSWIEVRNKVHVFGVGDVSHPRSESIYYELQGLMNRMNEEEGFLPDKDFSLHDVDEERECIPIGHSEMLAISFGLISTQAGTSLRITKNLRVCNNCHSSAKIISKMVEREIILKDPDCFHHFKDGYCSCGDIW